MLWCVVRDDGEFGMLVSNVRMHCYGVFARTIFSSKRRRNLIPQRPARESCWVRRNSGNKV